jgi:DNA-binding transcriptional LysR family regulator
LVSLDTLACLDSLIWLQTGKEVAKRFAYNQSNVSRQQKNCCEALGITLAKKDKEWVINQPNDLIRMERLVHQQARFQGLRSLRMEATYWSAPLLCIPEPEGWIVGLSNIVGIERNHQLVREAIIDAWLCSAPDLPDHNDPDLTSIRLCEMPIHLMVNKNHPLLRNKLNLSWDDITNFPSLALPDGAYPKTQIALQKLGLWNNPIRMSRYKRELWEGQSEADVTIGYGTCLSIAASQTDQVALQITLPFCAGEALVVRRERRDHPQTKELIDVVRQRIQALAKSQPEIQLV